MDGLVAAGSEIRREMISLEMCDMTPGAWVDPFVDIEVDPLVVSTAVARSAGYESTFAAIMALWIVRPRVGWLMYVYMGEL